MDDCIHCCFLPPHQPLEILILVCNDFPEVRFLDKCDVWLQILWKCASFVVDVFIEYLRMMDAVGHRVGAKRVNDGIGDALFTTHTEYVQRLLIVFASMNRGDHTYRLHVFLLHRRDGIIERFTVFYL